MKKAYRVSVEAALLGMIVWGSLTNLHAHEGPIHFHKISIEDGLSQSSVNCILQDRKGFLWFGTQDGLNRYDGYNFKIYKYIPGDPNSPSDNNIISICEDRSGNLWIGTWSGLDRFDPKTERFTHYRYDPANPSSVSHNRVNAICEDQSGILWVGTWGGLDRFDPKTEAFRHFRYSPSDSNSLIDDRINTIYEGRLGYLWIGTSSGLDRLDPATKEFIHYTINPKDPNSGGHNDVAAICEDRSGNLWVGTSSAGLFHFHREEERFTRYGYDPNNPNSLGSNDVRCIHEDRGGHIWIGTWGEGLSTFHPETKRFTHYRNDPNDPNSLSDNRLYCMYEDKSGILWIGTLGAGVNRMDPVTKKFTLYRKDPNNPNSSVGSDVRGIHEDHTGMLWISTFSGLNRFDPTIKKFTRYRHDPDDEHSLSSNLVYAVYSDPSGNVWAGTQGFGLNRLNPRTGRCIRYVHDPADPNSLSDNTVNIVFTDRLGETWIGTQNGLNRYERTRDGFVRYFNDPEDPTSLSDNDIRVIIEDRKGFLWFGTRHGGLNRFDPATGAFTQYRHDPLNPSSLSDDRIFCIHEDSTGIFWIGKRGGGLNRFDPITEQFICYTEKDGLPNNVIYGILEDGHGNLWLSTNNGLSKFSPSRRTFRNYYATDGLQSNEFNFGAYERLRSGEMVFGGIGGFNVFHPDSIKDNAFIPPVVIVGFQVFNRPVPIGEMEGGRTILERSITDAEKINLSYKDNVFSFEFAALNYIFPEMNKYAYMMEGLENTWNYVENRRFVTYTRLPSGNYVFRVKGSNNDGVWNEKGASLRITISPPFWRTWWFQSVCILLVSVLIVTAYQARTHSIRSRAKELELRVERRTVELREAYEGLSKEVAVRERIEKERQRRAAHAALIYEVGRRVSGELKLDTLLSEIVNAIQITFNYPSVGLLLLDEKDQRLHLQAIAGAYADIFPKDLSHALGEGMTGFAVQSGETQVSGDVNQDPHYVRDADEETKSELAVPIKKGEEMIGVLDIQSEKLDAFDAIDLEAMETMSMQLATAIQNARLYEQAQQEITERKQAEKEIQRRAGQAELIYNVGRHVSRELKLDALLSEIVTTIQKAFNYPSVALDLLDEKGARLNLKAVSGEYAYVFSENFSISIEEGMSGFAVRSGETQVSGDVSEDPHYLRVADESTKSELVVPIKTGEEVIGVLDIQSDKPDAFDAIDVEAMETMSMQLATAIQNARLYEQAQQEITERKQAEKEIQRRAGQAALIYEVGQRVSGELKLEALLSEIVTAVQDAFNYYTVGLLLCDEEAGRLTLQSAAGSYTDIFPEGLWLAIGEGMIGYAAANGETQFSGDVSKDPHYVSKAGGETKSELSVPIKSGEKVVGVLDI
ncbi:MAG: two-component regulator propeller domain-containing protein, partial [bacterium]